MLILRSLELLSSDIENLVFVIAGIDVPSDREEILQLTSSLKKSRNVQVIDVGEIGEEEKIALLKDSDVFAMPSIVDSFGLVYLEAWACQTPVIACRGTPQESFIEHNRDGLLVSSEDAAEFSSQLQTLLCDNDRRVEMGLQGYKKLLENFTPDQAANRLEAIYKSVLRG